MRIGFDVTSLDVPQSGVGTYTANLFQHLRRGSMDEILPLSYSHNTADSFPVSNGSRSCRINKTVWMQTILPLELRRLKPDLVHFTNSTAPLISPCPMVITIHDMTLWLMPEHHPMRRRASMRPIIPHVARQAAAIIAVSESARDDIIRTLRLPEDKIYVIYEAAAPEFKPLDDQDILREVQARYNLPLSFILYVGTIEPRKNLVRVLEAFARLREANRIDHTLVFVGGSGWNNKDLYEAIERLNLASCVRFLGHVPFDDLPAIYNLADVLAFPSLYEGFGLPVIEAMACGTPVVTSNGSSLKEIAGEAAELVDPLDVDSIAEGLHCVLHDQEHRADLRKRGLAQAARFSWKDVAENTRQVYEEVISQK